jgi:hypothetical protein
MELLWRTGKARETLEVCEMILADTSGSEGEHPAERSRAYETLALAARNQGNLPQSITHFESAVATRWPARATRRTSGAKEP